MKFCVASVSPGYLYEKHVARDIMAFVAQFVAQFERLNYQFFGILANTEALEV